MFINCKRLGCPAFYPKLDNMKRLPFIFLLPCWISLGAQRAFSKSLPVPSGAPDTGLNIVKMEDGYLIGCGTEPLVEEITSATGIEGDTVSLQSDSVRYWISQVPTLPHQYVLVGQYLQEADTIQALTAMNAIPANFPLSPSQQEAHGGYQDLVQMKKGQIEKGDWMAFALENQGELAALADQGISRGAIQAQHYYNFVFGETYYPVIEWTSGGSQSAGKVQTPLADQNPQETEKAFSEVKLEVIPNPARESVQFQYALPVAGDQAWLRLYDPSGRMIQIWELQLDKGTIQWQVDGLATKGLYLVSLAIGGSPPLTRRFSVVE